MRLEFETMFNNETLSIFTDASIYKYKEMGYTLSCPGALCMVTSNNQCNILESNYSTIIFNSTNNEGEISAIQLGLYYALKYKDRFKNINLYSDSNICVQGLNNWIYSWIDNIHNGIMYSSSGTPVANQSIICSILNTILSENINIKIMHQKGHVNINNEASMNKALKDFIITNGLKGQYTVDIDIIRCISFYNDIVDKETKKTLQDYIQTNHIMFDTIKPVQFYPNIKAIKEHRKI